LKVWVIAVGRTGRLLEEAIAEYETRARRYWTVEVVEVREEKARGDTGETAVKQAEAERLLRRVPEGAEVVALTRRGDAWSSKRLAQHMERQAAQGSAGIAFLIGGAYGLADSILKEADRRMRLSTFTMPHDLARLVLLEQIYRAGTIVRGEPYHKGTETP
jgi:23S rRNA (pseudouridine1915-N3)-methyltransferase